MLLKEDAAGTDTHKRLNKFLHKSGSLFLKISVALKLIMVF